MRYKNSLDSKNIAFFDKEKLNTEIEEKPLLNLPLNETPYGVGFFKELFTRSSCFSCVSRNFSSGSDVTIGDFWSAKKHFKGFNNTTGTSAIIIKTEKGREIWNKIKSDFISKDATIEQLVVHNPRLIKSGTSSKNRAKFRKDFLKNPKISTLVKYTWFYIWKQKLKRFVKRILKP